MLGLWPIALLIGVLILVAILLLRTSKRNQQAASFSYQLDRLDDAVFERYLALLFTRMGYQIRPVNYAGQTRTLVATKNGISYVIQARRNRKTVGIKAIEDAVATRRYLKCERAIVVTNHYFSSRARRAAKLNRVLTLDRHDLIKELSHLGPNNLDYSDQPTLETEFFS